MRFARGQRSIRGMSSSSTRVAGVMRGQVNFGWDDSKPTKAKNGFGSETTN